MPVELGSVKNNWFCSDPGLRRDFIEGAQSSADITRHVQAIHFHRADDECGDRAHLIIEPSEPRSTAVGGKEHHG